MKCWTFAGGKVAKGIIATFHPRKERWYVNLGEMKTEEGIRWTRRFGVHDGRRPVMADNLVMEARPRVVTCEGKAFWTLGTPREDEPMVLLRILATVERGRKREGTWWVRRGEANALSGPWSGSPLHPPIDRVGYDDLIMARPNTVLGIRLPNTTILHTVTVREDGILTITETPQPPTTAPVHQTPFSGILIRL